MAKFRSFFVCACVKCPLLLDKGIQEKVRVFGEECVRSSKAPWGGGSMKSLSERRSRPIL